MPPCHSRSEGDLRDTEEPQDEAQSGQVRFQRLLRKVLGIYGLAERNRGKSRESQYSPRNAISSDHQATAVADRENSCLKRFISRSTDKCLSFFKILKKAFERNGECEEAFGKLKEHLTNPPLLSSSDEGEILYLYLAVSPSIVSSALVREDSGIQKSVYFTSKALHGAEERYPRIEKLAFALIVSARRLRPYFQAHVVWVLTEYTMKKILQKPDLSGKLVNW